MKLLLIEDELRLGTALVYLLRANGYIVDLTSDGDTGLEKATTKYYDLIILDWMLPGRDGISIIKELRGQGFNNPVLFLTCKDLPKDRVEGLDSGADDYLVKPFAAEELLARIRALTRRKAKDWVGNFINAAGMILDPLKGEVIKGEEVIRLTVKETLLLELLMRNQGHVITKEQIIARVWGFDSEVEFSNIDLYIHYLRKKLCISYIKTIRGVGYLLREEADVS